MVNLILSVQETGIQRPHCFLYSPKCGKCDKPAAVRSVKPFKLEIIECIEIAFQCDHCKLKWHIHAFMTKKNIRGYGPKFSKKEVR